MNCNDAIDQVFLYLDGELCEVDCQSFLTHINDCTPCREQFEGDQRFKALVQRCCGGDKAAEELKDKVRAKLRAFAPNVTTS